MNNIRETIAKDASDRLAVMAEETKTEVVSWIKNNMKKQGELLDNIIEVLTLIYGEEVDDVLVIHKIVGEQFLSTIEILAQEIKDELDRLN